MRHRRGPDKSAVDGRAATWSEHRQDICRQSHRDGRH